MKKKYLSFIFAFVCIITCGLCLTACVGGNQDDSQTQRVFKYATCQIAEGRDYTILNDFEILISKDVNIREIINKNSFVVTAHYSNNETEVVTEGYTFNIYDENYESYKYKIEVSYNDSILTTIYVKVENATLPTLTNVAPNTDGSSGYHLTKELRYNPSPVEYNILNEITTSDNAPDNFLKNLIDANKVYVDENFSSNTKNDTPNTYCGDGVYESYSLRVCANEGYKWVINGEDVTYLDISWQIKRAILETPELTSGTEFTFKHEWNENEGKYLPVEQGLTFDYKGNEDYFSTISKETSADYYYSTLSIKDEFQKYFAFELNGEETVSTQVYWSIAKMQVEMPTITGGTVSQNEVHYTYTGEEIQPHIQSDVINLFDITRPTYSINAREYSYSIEIALKTDYYKSNNYEFNTGYLSYYIDKAPFPQNISNDIEGINFTLEKEYNGNTYSAYVQWLSWHDFTNSDEELKKTGYDGNSSSLIFELPETLPTGITGDSVLNASGYPVKVTYSYNSNYEPIEFTAKLYITPIGYGVANSWDLYKDSSSGNSGYVSGDDLVYDENTTYTCTLSSVNDYYLNVTYTINYGVTNALGSTAQEIKDAGYYSVVATITPKGGTTNYFVYVEGDEAKTPITQLLYPMFQIEKKTIGDYPSYGTYNYYYKADTERTLTVNSVTSWHYENFVDMESITSTVEYRIDENSNWASAQNTIDVGQYKTTFTWTIANEFKKNYQLENGGAEKVWEIYPNVYDLQTTNKNAPNYIGWNVDDITLYYGDKQADDALKNYVTIPKGLDVLFSYENNPYPSYQEVTDVTSANFGNNTYYTRSGDNYTVATEYVENETYYIRTWGYTGSSTWCSNELGDYLAWAKLTKYPYDGNDQLTITIDGASVTQYETSWIHFKIIEHDPVAYTIGNEQEFVKDGFKYFAFTTGDATDYILKTNNYNAGFSYRLATGSDYTPDLNKATLDSSLYYYLLTGLTPNTQYVLRIGKDNYSPEQRYFFIIKEYTAQVTYAYNGAIAKKPQYDGDASSMSGLIVAGVANAGPTVNVPYSIYTTSGTENRSYRVYALAENAFKDNTTLTTIYLPGHIYNIGNYAFAGCTNLTDIYFDYANGDWESILFGVGVFDGCNNPITVHTNNGDYYLNKDNSLTPKA